jgi:hypothetical protein
MLARATLRASQQQLAAATARRGFQTTRAQLSSPYHYPEGPLSNLPFNPRTKGFKYGFWTYCVVGFTTPIWIAGMCYHHPRYFWEWVGGGRINADAGLGCSLADLPSRQVNGSLVIRLDGG